MPWELAKDFTFEAAHQLPNHSGKCARLHGHSWKLTVYVEGDRLFNNGSPAGMVQDFGDVSAVVKPLLESHLDHYFLNETTGLENPTSEELARWIYERIASELPGLTAVEIAETCTCRCRYTPSR